MARSRGGGEEGGGGDTWQGVSRVIPLSLHKSISGESSKAKEKNGKDDRCCLSWVPLVCTYSMRLRSRCCLSWVPLVCTYSMRLSWVPLVCTYSMCLIMPSTLPPI